MPGSPHGRLPEARNTIYMLTCSFLKSVARQHVLVVFEEDKKNPVTCMISYHLPQEKFLLENCPRSVLNASQVRIRCERQVEVDHVDVVEGSSKGAQRRCSYTSSKISLPLKSNYWVVSKRKRDCFYLIHRQSKNTSVDCGSWSESCFAALKIVERKEKKLKIVGWNRPRKIECITSSRVDRTRVDWVFLAHS